jgi:hypothetical protein
MDSYADVVGVVVVLTMIRVGWGVLRTAWEEGTRPRPELVLDLREPPYD